MDRMDRKIKEREQRLKMEQLEQKQADLAKRNLRLKADEIRENIRYQQAVNERSEFENMLNEQIAQEQDLTQTGGGYGLVTSPGQDPLALLGNQSFGGQGDQPLTSIDEPASMATLGDRGPVDALAALETGMVEAAAPQGSGRPMRRVGPSLLYREPRPTHDALWELMQAAEPESSEYYGEPVRRKAEDRLAGLFEQQEQMGLTGTRGRYMPMSIYRARKDEDVKASRERMQEQDRLIKERQKEADERRLAIWNVQYGVRRQHEFDKIAATLDGRILLDELSMYIDKSTDVFLSKEENAEYANRAEVTKKKIDNMLSSLKEVKPIKAIVEPVEVEPPKTEHLDPEADKQRLLNELEAAQKAGDKKKHNELWPITAADFEKHRPTQTGVTGADFEAFRPKSVDESAFERFRPPKPASARELQASLKQAEPPGVPTYPTAAMPTPTFELPTGPTHLKGSLVAEEESQFLGPKEPEPTWKTYLGKLGERIGKPDLGEYADLPESFWQQAKFPYPLEAPPEGTMRVQEMGGGKKFQPDLVSTLFASQELGTPEWPKKIRVWGGLGGQYREVELPKTVQEGINRSPVWAAEWEAITGKKPYDLKGWKPSWLQDKVATVVSYLTPDALAIFSAGGKAGSNLMKRFLNTSIAKGVPPKVAARVLIPAGSGAGGLGAYDFASTAARGGSPEDVFWATLRGAALGGLAGGAGGAAGMKIGKAAVLPAEVVAFGTVAPLMEGRLPTLFDEHGNFTGGDYADATAIILGMRAARAVGRAFKKAGEKAIEPKIRRSTIRVLRDKYDISKDEAGKFYDAAKENPEILRAAPRILRQLEVEMEREKFSPYLKTGQMIPGVKHIGLSGETARYRANKLESLIRGELEALRTGRWTLTQTEPSATQHVRPGESALPLEPMREQPPEYTPPKPVPMPAPEREEEREPYEFTRDTTQPPPYDPQAAAKMLEYARGREAMREPKPEPVRAKEPWEMTRGEFEQQYWQEKDRPISVLNTPASRKIIDAVRDRALLPETTEWTVGEIQQAKLDIRGAGKRVTKKQQAAIDHLENLAPTPENMRKVLVKRAAAEGKIGKGIEDYPDLAAKYGKGEAETPPPPLKRGDTVGGEYATFPVSQLRDLPKVMEGLKGESYVKRAEENLKQGKIFPVVVEQMDNGQWTITDGRHTLEAAQRLGLDDVAVRFADKEGRPVSVEHFVAETQGLPPPPAVEQAVEGVRAVPATTYQQPVETKPIGNLGLDYRVYGDAYSGGEVVHVVRDGDVIGTAKIQRGKRKTKLIGRDAVYGERDKAQLVKAMDAIEKLLPSEQAESVVKQVEGVRFTETKEPGGKGKKVPKPAAATEVEAASTRASAIADFWESKQGTYKQTRQTLPPGGKSGKAKGGTLTEINERRAFDNARKFRALAEKGELTNTELDDIKRAWKRLPKELRQATASERLSFVRGADVFDKFASLVKREFRVGGRFPRQIHELKNQMKGKVNAQLRKIRFTQRDFNKAKRKTYGLKELDPKTENLLNSALKGEVDPNKLPEPVAGQIVRMRREIDVLSRQLAESGAVTDEMAEIIQNNYGHYVNRSYRIFDDPKAWPKIVTKKYPELIQQVHDLIKSENPELTPAQINGEIDLLLSHGEPSVFDLLNAGKLGSKNLGILKHRKEIPYEIRALWGEHTDPFVNYAKSTLKMTDLLAKHEFLEQVKQDGLLNDYMVPPKAGPVYHKGVPLTKQISSKNSKVLEPLSGHWTTEDIKREFELSFSNQNIDNFWRTYYLAIGTTKYAKTVGSWQTQVRNFLANPLIAISNGHWGWWGPGAAKKMFTDLTGGGDEAIRKEIVDLTRRGVLHDSAHANEIRSMIKDATNMDIDAFTEKHWGVTSKAAKKGLRFLSDVYRTGDEFWKVVGYYNEIGLLKSAYPEKSVGEIKDMAAQNVRDLYPTWSNIPRGVQRLRRFPFLGTFVTFHAEVMRNMYNRAKLIYRELNDPATRKIGARRLLGQVAAFSLPYALVQASKQFAGGVRKETDEDVRRFVAPWTKNSEFTYLSAINDGRVNIVDLTYTTPYALEHKSARAAMRAVKGKQNIHHVFAELFEPFLSEDIFTRAVLDVVRNKKPETGAQVYNPQEPFEKRLQDISMHMLEPLKPGTWNSMVRIWRGRKPRESIKEYGRAYDWSTELAAMLSGFRAQTVDVRQALHFKAKRYVDERKEANRIFLRLLHRRGAVHHEVLATARERSEQARKKLFAEIHEDFWAARRLGVPERDIRVGLYKAGIPKSEIGRIANNRYLPYVPSELTQEARDRVTSAGISWRE
jgi:hypothetical protein